MRVARAAATSSLVPLLGIAVVGFGLGYSSVLELGQFVLLWAVFLYPLAVVLTLCLYFFSRWLGPTGRWHFGVAGFLGGAVLALGWGPLQPADGSSPIPPTLVFCLGAGFVGASTAVLFWQLSLGARAA